MPPGTIAEPLAAIATHTHTAQNIRVRMTRTPLANVPQSVANDSNTP